MNPSTQELRYNNIAGYVYFTGFSKKSSSIINKKKNDVRQLFAHSDIVPTTFIYINFLNKSFRSSTLASFGFPGAHASA